MSVSQLQVSMINRLPGIGKKMDPPIDEEANRHPSLPEREPDLTRSYTSGAESLVTQVASLQNPAKYEVYWECADAENPRLAPVVQGTHRDGNEPRCNSDQSLRHVIHFGNSWVAGGFPCLEVHRATWRHNVSSGHGCRESIRCSAK